MAVRLLHVADLHLGWFPSYLEDLAEARQQERDQLLKRIVDYAVDERNGIDIVAIAGDLFETHSPPSGELVTRVIRELRRITGAGIILITVPGNHDEITYHDSVYKVRGSEWPGILVTNPMPQHVATFNRRGIECHIYSMAYTGGLTRTSPPVSLVPRVSRGGVHIGIFHGSLASGEGNYDDRSLPLDPDSVKGCGYNYIAMGHIHRKNHLHLGDSQLLYPGIIEGKGFSDPGEGNLTVVTLDEGGTKVEDVPLKTRPIRSKVIDITAFSSQEELEEAIKTEGDAEAIQRIEFSGVWLFPLSLEDLMRKVRPYYYYIEVLDHASIISEDLLEGYMKEPTVSGIFVRKIFQAISECEDEREKERLRKALLYGLSSMNPSISR